jgi:hypothetical protein
VQAIAARIDDLEFLNGAAQRSLAACRDAFDWATRGATLADALTSAAARGQPHTHRS